MLKNFVGADGQRKFFLAPKFLTCAHGSVILEAQDFKWHGRV